MQKSSEIIKKIVEINTKKSEINNDNNLFSKYFAACVFIMGNSLAVILVNYIQEQGIYPTGFDVFGHLFKSNLLYENIKEGNLYPLYTNLWYNGLQPFRYWAEAYLIIC